MKKIIRLVITFLVVSVLGQAQEMNKCASTEAMLKKASTDKKFAKRVEETTKQREKLNSFKTAGGNVYIIPVVFHILHQGGGENISNAQVEDAVRILNVDYRKLNPDTTDIVTEFKQLAADIEIEFRLATIDPDGNCTNGIIRHNTPATNFDASYSYTGVGPGLWDPQKYLCFYICKTLDFPGAAAYTYIPGWLGAGNPADAVVSLHSYVGSIGSSSPFTSRVLTHEVGHWLGLDHVWGGTNDPGVACGDDGVGDTPVTMGWSSCNLTNNQVCTPGVTENVQNYMEYSYCDKMFTIGQKNLMRNVIATGANSGRDNLVSPSNLLATGVTNPQVCAPVADFITVNNKYNYCTGQSIQFRDNTLNSHPTIWNWDFPGGTPNASTDSMPTVSYASPGLYAVSYTATNTGGTSNISKSNYISIVSNTADYSSVFNEGFEVSTIPGTDWITENSMDANTWVETSTASSSGTKSAMINNFTNTTGDIEVLYSPSFDLNAINSANPPVAFTFKLAYQRSTTSANEKLQVFSSINCGQTWLQRYAKTGSSLSTVAGTTTSAFVPTSANDWRTETVSVSAINTQSNVFFKFVFTSDAAGNKNNIYIDDINIAQSVVGINEQYENTLNLQLFPNPSKETTSLQFTLTKSSDISVKVLDVLGKEVDTVMNKKLGSGVQQIDLNNYQRSSGVYFIVLSIDGNRFIKKMIVE
ncbi:MAG: M43 family zinc metalloprotease [Bacteroidota bacterium]|nr:M43 family zinc metalloprotease [Bacteroidota bacterium]